MEEKIPSSKSCNSVLEKHSNAENIIDETSSELIPETGNELIPETGNELLEETSTEIVDETSTEIMIMKIQPSDIIRELKIMIKII